MLVYDHLWPVTTSLHQNHGYFMASERKLCVCLWIKGFVADSAAVQCHTGSTSGMFPSTEMGCGVSLAEPPLPVACQPALGTAYHRITLGKQHLPVDDFWLVSICVTVWHLSGFFICLNTALFGDLSLYFFNLSTFLRHFYPLRPLSSDTLLHLRTESTLFVIQSLFHNQTSPATCATLKKPIVGSRVVLLCPVSLYSQLTLVCFPLFSLSSGETVQEEEI